MSVFITWPVRGCFRRRFNQNGDADLNLGVGVERVFTGLVS